MSELDAMCKALWDSEPHKMLAMAGHPIDYESQPETIKMDLRRSVRAILKAQSSDEPAKAECERCDEKVITNYQLCTALEEAEEKLTAANEELANIKAAHTVAIDQLEKLLADSYEELDALKIDHGLRKISEANEKQLRESCEAALAERDEELAKREGEIAQLKSQVDFWNGSAVGEEIAGLRKDAERYQHLKNLHGYSYAMGSDAPAEVGIAFNWVQSKPEEQFWSIDNAIDNEIEFIILQEKEDSEAAQPQAKAMGGDEN